MNPPKTLWNSNSVIDINGMAANNLLRPNLPMIKNVLNIFLLLIFVSTTIGQTNIKVIEIDELAQKCAAGHVESCNKLVDIAKNENDPRICIPAIEKLTDQRVLKEIAENEKGYTMQREAAVKKITDQGFLEDLAKNSKNPDVCEAAINQITDQSFLISIAKNHFYYPIRKTAVEKITNQSILADIAQNDKSFDVREAAVKKITEQKLLMDIAEFNDDDLIQLIALDQLKINDCYQRIVFILNQNITKHRNLAALAALKIIPGDVILKKYYEKFEINSSYKTEYQNYSYDYGNRGAGWTCVDFSIKINLNDSIKIYRYLGERGSTVESLRNIKRFHLGSINISEICDFLILPVSREDLIKMSETSDVYYLRETAKKRLEQKN